MGSLFCSEKERACRHSGSLSNMSIRKVATPKDQAAAHKGAGSTRSVDLSNMSIRKAAVPKDQAAAHKGE